MQRAQDRGEGSGEPGGPCAAVRSDRGSSRGCSRALPEAEMSPAFLWLEPGKAREVAARGLAARARRRGRAGQVRASGPPRRFWRCSRWSCGSATRRARTSGSGCLGRWPTSSSRCWPGSRCVSRPPRVGAASRCLSGQPPRSG